MEEAQVPGARRGVDPDDYRDEVLIPVAAGTEVPTVVPAAAEVQMAVVEVLLPAAAEVPILVPAVAGVLARWR